MFDQQEKHESYGMIAVDRISGSGRSLFGSSIQHHNTIRITISEADISRGLNRDFIFARKRLLEIEMSPTQWAEAITNTNTEGVPCTIRRVQGKEMDACPFTSKRKQFEDEFKQDLADLSLRLDILLELATALSKTKTVNVEQKTAILREVKAIQQEIASNIPYVATQFNKQMDRTVLEAKGEFEAMVQHTITSLGLKALKAEDVRMLDDGEKEK